MTTIASNPAAPNAAGSNTAVPNTAASNTTTSNIAASDTAELYQAASAMDIALGHPNDEANPLGFNAMVTRDAAEAFPVKLASRVAPDLALCFVPAEYGGELTTVDDSLMRVRVAARRDVTVMPATMFSITAATCVLLAGSPEQREQVVKLLFDGRPIGFALSEADHGSDLLANSCELDSTEGQLRLTGEKWLVGLGERCDAAVVVARSGGNQRRHPAAFTAVLVDGQALRDARGGWQRPTGMRGIDFVGLRFDDAELDRTALVGQPGHGMETAMKAMQVVRVYSTAANLACADTGLRLTMDFARNHRVAGRQASTYPAVRRELSTAAAAMFACDAVALTTARALQALPGQASIAGSVAKKVLTDGSEEIFTRCTDVLGTRSLLRDGRFAAFEVARRDNAVVRFIDTSPVANLRLVAMQLAQWAAGFNQLPDPFAVTSGLVAAFDLDAELPAMRLDALQLSARGRDEVTAALPFVADAARAALGEDPGPDTRAQADRAVLRLSALEMALDGLSRDVLQAKERLGAAFGGSLEQLDLTERFCWLHAAASCVHLWWFNRGRSLFGGEPASTGWLSAALFLLLDRAGGSAGRLDAEDTESAFDLLGRMHGRGHLFSAVSLPLAESVGTSRPNPSSTAGGASRPAPPGTGRPAPPGTGRPAPPGTVGHRPDPSDTVVSRRRSLP
jgi:alkylation response protein AidB-like acyl-CoA dehydrogenase